MNILFTKRFKLELNNIVDYIARDNVINATNFYYDIFDKVYLIPDNPFAYRN
jgi:plasmid stabilization system protein ParE